MGERIPQQAMPTLELTYTEEARRNLDLYAKLSFLDVPESWGDKMYEDGTGEGAFAAVSVGPRFYFSETKRSRFGVGLGFELYAGEYDVKGVAAGIYHVDLDERLWGVSLNPHFVWEHGLGKTTDTKFVITLGYNLTETVTDDPAHVDLDGPAALFELQKPLPR
jgi:hypothetical protein